LAITTTTTLSEQEQAQIQLEDDARLMRQVWRDSSDVTGQSSQQTHEFLEPWVYQLQTG
jgi:hypothetical protein